MSPQLKYKLRSPFKSPRTDKKTRTHKKIEIDFKTEQRVNDNAVYEQYASSRLAPIAFALGFGAVCLVALTNLNSPLNMNNIISQAVIHTDDSVLALAMEASPEALGAALNAVGPGE